MADTKYKLELLPSTHAKIVVRVKLTRGVESFIAPVWRSGDAYRVGDWERTVGKVNFGKVKGGPMLSEQDCTAIHEAITAADKF